MKSQFGFPTQLGRVAFSTRFVSISYRPSSRYLTSASHWPNVYRIALPSGLLDRRNGLLFKRAPVGISIDYFLLLCAQVSALLLKPMGLA